MARTVVKNPARVVPKIVALQGQQQYYENAILETQKQINKLMRRLGKTEAEIKGNFEAGLKNMQDQMRSLIQRGVNLSKASDEIDDDDDEINENEKD
jgi:hypothetical protein